MTGGQLNSTPVAKRTGGIGILAALPEEIAGLIERMAAPDGVSAPAERIQWGRRDFHRGTLHGTECVVALSRIGKVAAAATVSTLIHRFDVSAIVFVGVAGGMGDQVRVGDVVIGDHLLQHDLNAEPLFPRFEVPLLERARFEADSALSNALAHATTAFLATLADTQHTAPRLHRGLIASGDRFVSGHTERAVLVAALPDLLAVDMESAAVAQVCYEHDVPVAILRSISDSADDSAAMSFSHFLKTVASRYADGILERFLSSMPD